MSVKHNFYKTLLSTCLISTALLSPVHATALQKMFESLGGDANVTSPGSVQHQAAGHLTGGGIVVRTRNKVVQPITVSLPHVKAGCGGLDMYLGAVSMVTKEELVTLMKNMATSVPTYAFQLAMKTMAPQLENLMTQLRKMVQDMNATMLDSCQMGQNLVGGVWPKNTAASEMICEDAMRGSGKDWFGAREHCKNKDAVSAKVSEARERSPDLIQGEYNLTYHVLKKMPGYKDDPDFISFIMTTVGTLISKKDEDGRFVVKHIAGKAEEKDYFAAFLKGGTVERYKCDEDRKCLNIIPPETFTIQDNDLARPQSLTAKTSKMLGDIWQGYRDDNREMTPQELAFLNDAAGLPVYRYIQISAAMGSPYAMGDTAEYIAIHVLLAQFDRISGEIMSALETLQSIQLESETIEKFKQNIQAMRGRLQALAANANGTAVWRLNQTIQAHEQTLAARNN